MFRRAGRTIVLRFVALTALAFWVGGFTFYSAVVIPALHEALGSTETGFITQRVTDTLNVIGAVTVALWWLLVVPERGSRTRFGLLVGTTILLGGLFVLHLQMDRMLETTGLGRFSPWHRAYLLASTAQWFLNLGLLLSVVRAQPVEE